jgi:Ribbon-helix-helix protein, copG family
MSEPKEGDIVEFGGQQYILGPDIDLDVEEVYDDAGNRITEAAADAMAKDASARAGRPSLTAPGERSPQVTVRLPIDLRRRIEARARAEHRSLSALARDAFEHYLAG